MTAPAMPALRRTLLFGGPIALLGALLLWNAWVVDDAYITFRSVDHWVHGRGMVWNADERVQAYTHPLWMMLMSAAYFATRELFFTSILLSLALSLAAVAIAACRATGCMARDAWRVALLAVGLAACKAFVDFASSGLENPLSYLLAAAFLFLLLDPRLREGPPSPRDAAILSLLASLSFLNRMDTILLFAPAMAWVLWRARAQPKGKLLAILAATSAPAWGWLLFSTFYYGFPFPNTAYAKAFATGFPTSWKVERGLEYLGNSIRLDFPAYLLALAAAGIAAWRRSLPALMLLAGCVLYTLYVVVSAASATHMSGRFFAVPLFIAISLLAAQAEWPKAAWGACAALAVFLAWSPVSPFKHATRFYDPGEVAPNAIDTKWFVALEGAALANWRPGVSMPNHAWRDYGEHIRDQPGRVHLGGAFGGEAVGYTGFFAGPDKHIVDFVALTDPLLARLPAVPLARGEWRSGHFRRGIPAGYLESLEARENLIEDPAVRALYDDLLLATRGPLLAPGRLRAIMRLNTGAHADAGNPP